MKYQLKNKDVELDIDNITESLLRINGMFDVQAYIDAGKVSFGALTSGFELFTGDSSQAEYILNIKDTWAKPEETKFGILVDSDYDGMASGAIMCKFLISKGVPEDNIIVYLHEGKEHGLSDTKVFLEIKEDKPDYLFVPDAGSNDAEQCTILKHECHMTIIIFDHHEIETRNKDAFVVNPYCETGHNNPYLNLSGAGVTLITLMRSGYVPTQEDYEVVAMSVVSDHMDCRSFVNRWLLDRGFGHYPTHPLFKTMVDGDMYNNIKELNPIYCDFNIIPRFNAIIRIGEQEEKEMLFGCIAGKQATFDYVKRDKSIVKETLAERVSRIGKNAQSRQSRLVNKDVDTICEYIDNNNLAENKVLLLETGKFPEINSVLKGITASRVSEKYNRPVIICSWNENDSMFEGSIRNNCDYITDFKELLTKSKLCEVAGHGNAAGFKCKDEESMQKIVGFVNQLCSASDYEKTYYVDSILDYDNIDMFTATQIEGFKKYAGAGIDEPVFYIKNIPFNTDETTIMGKDNNTVKFSDGVIDCIKFHFSGSPIKELMDDWYNGTINAIGKVGLKYYEGVFQPQIIIEDVEKADEEDYW